ncbi:MAG: methyltransferase domain-containing protein [Kiritimatiellaeota bacterium]|nr:methyltransferase domain-containing protein [Kiritimatiellota bacterium]
MTTCYLCRNASVKWLLEFKQQPVCNRFLVDPHAVQYRHDLAAGQCQACGLVQLLDPVPAQELMPRVDWITCNEPEGHLDRLAEMLAGLPGLTPQATIAGISFKDDSILSRMQERGFSDVWRLSPDSDVGIAEQRSGVETLQDRLTPEQAETIMSHRRPADVLIMRHVWEHAFQPLRLMAALHKLLKPDGYLVLEVPDCARALANGDYTTLWEEHSLYFTPATFRSGLARSGLEPVCLECFPYPFENSLVAIARYEGRPKAERLSKKALVAEIDRANTFANQFPIVRDRIRTLLAEHRRQGGRIAVFGAGHLACAFINFMDLHDLVECVVDDHPKKRGLFMPGSALPICGSEALLDRKITFCLLSLSPESEEKVIARNQAYIQQGGRFASIIPASKHALR